MANKFSDKVPSWLGFALCIFDCNALNYPLRKSMSMRTRREMISPINQIEIDKNFKEFDYFRDSALDRYFYSNFSNAILSCQLNWSVTELKYSTLGTVRNYQLFSRSEKLLHMDGWLSRSFVLRKMLLPLVQMEHCYICGASQHRLCCPMWCIDYIIITPNKFLLHPLLSV